MSGLSCIVGQEPWQPPAIPIQTKRHLVRCPFTQEEDKALCQLVDMYGQDWELIASKIPGRNTRQVKERWTNYLSSDVENRPWTSEEDALLYEKQKEYGPKWKRISTFFEKRTDVHVKNRWRLLQRAEMRKLRKQRKLLIQEANRRLMMFEKKRTAAQVRPPIPAVQTQTVSMDDIDPLGTDDLLDNAFELMDFAFADFSAF